MKKAFTLFLVAILSAGTIAFANTDDSTATSTDTTEMTDTAAAATEETIEEPVAPVTAPTEESVVEESAHQILKEIFIEGGWIFMSIVTVCLILGLAFAFERIISLNLNEVNNAKFVGDVQNALSNGGVDSAKELCKNTRGPIASVFYQGLDRAKEGLDVVEKSIVSYGSVQMGQLEKGLVWIALFIALAPMLGFMGTVIGMIDAFDQIQAAGDIQPSMVAGGIKVALLTTLAGLIVAIILQVFYNYIVSKIDAIVNDMEDTSIQLMDMLIAHDKK